MGPLSLRASCTHTRVRCTRFHLEAEWPTDRQLENRVASALQQYARRDPEARETLAASRLTQSPSVLDSSERLGVRSAFESSQVLRTGISHPADRHHRQHRFCTPPVAVLLVKFIRTPVGVFSNDSIAPKFSCTTMLDSRNAAATAAETSASACGRMCGPASRTCIREPKALKIEPTSSPVSPPPT